MTKKSTMIVLVLTLGLATTATILADGSGRKATGNRRNQGLPDGQMFLDRILNNQRMVEKLGLSEDQVSTLRNGIFDLKKEKIQKQAELQIAATEQARILTESEIDESALMATVEQTGQVRTELAKLHMQGLLLMHKTLTKEQRGQIGPMLQNRMRQGRQNSRDVRGKDQRRPGEDRDAANKQRDHRGPEEGKPQDKR